VATNNRILIVDDEPDIAMVLKKYGLIKDVCANHNHGTEQNLINAVRRYLRYV
jgi:hypothetical protein